MTTISIPPRHPSEEQAWDVVDAASAVRIRELLPIFKLISDATRLRILLHLMRHGELHVRGLCDLLGQSQPAVSHHLALLRAARLIDFRREGRCSYYRIVTRRIETALKSLFADLSDDGRSLRFRNYVLSCQSEAQLEPATSTD